MPTRILSELKRRGVLHAAGIYAAAAFVALQAADLILPALTLDESAYRLMVWLILAGFPVTLIVSWFFELTPEGVRRMAGNDTASPSGRRLQAVSVAVILVMLAAAGGLTGVRASLDEPRSEDGRIGVAVFPFRATESAWAEGLPDLLATALDGTEGFRVIDPWGLWAPLRESAGAVAVSPDPARAAELAQGANARRYVLGALVAAGDSLEINVRIYDPRFARPLDTFSFAASQAGIARAVERLAVEIITRLWDQDALPGAHRLEPNVTRSPDALKAYLAARMAMRRGQVDSAVVAIDRALALDSTFALALTQAVDIRSWWLNMRGQRYAGFFPLLERAAAHDDSLSERHRLRIDAMTASVRTDGTVAAAALRRVLEIDSTDVAAWGLLAYVHAAYGWQYGATEAMARGAAERVLRLDSAYTPGITAYAWLQLATLDSVDPAPHIARLQRIDTTTYLARSALRALRLIAAADSAVSAVIEAIASAPQPEWTTPIRYARAFRPERVDPLLTRLRQLPPDAAPAAFPWTEWARFHVAAGNAPAVDSVLAAGTFTAHGVDWQVSRLLVAAALSGASDTAVARRAAARLAGYVPIANALSLWNQRPVWSVAWLLGAWHAQFGDPALGRRWRDTIGRFPPGGSPTTYREGLQADIDARLAVRAGRIDEALARAREARDFWYIHSDAENEALSPSPAIRFHLAMLERETGGIDAAEGLLRSLVPPTTWSGPFTTRAYFELAEIAAARGDSAGAARRYARALRLWELGGAPASAWAARAANGLGAGRERALR
jgi:tetratricopeptide (TPR) repeat protein